MDINQQKLKTELQEAQELQDEWDDEFSSYQYLDDLTCPQMACILNAVINAGQIICEKHIGVLIEKGWVCKDRPILSTYAYGRLTECGLIRENGM